MKKLLFTISILMIVEWNAFAQPTGTIIAFGGPQDKIPKGWIPCEGQLLDRTDNRYKALFDAIGSSWGNDAGNKFAVPDLRGMFLRGASGESNNDPEKELRTNSRPDLHSPGNGGNSVGSRQADGFGFHNHNFADNGHRHRAAGGWSVNNGSATPGGGELTNGALSRGDHFTSSEHSNITFRGEGGAETRPKNVYVYYIIKL